MTKQEESLWKMTEVLAKKALELEPKARKFNRMWQSIEDYGFECKSKYPVDFIELSPYDVSDLSWRLAQAVWRKNRSMSDWDQIEEGQASIPWWRQKGDRIYA